MTATQEHSALRRPGRLQWQAPSAPLSERDPVGSAGATRRRPPVAGPPITSRGASPDRRTLSRGDCLHSTCKSGVTGHCQRTHHPPHRSGGGDTVRASTGSTLPDRFFICQPCLLGADRRLSAPGTASDILGRHRLRTSRSVCSDASPSLPPHQQGYVCVFGDAEPAWTRKLAHGPARRFRDSGGSKMRVISLIHSLPDHATWNERFFTVIFHK